eukprot:TRINITY_DN8406_c0_g1_i7.p1 TRINITY_DN8406_c0_g1~~TRINITY_DN8406_c0_g1_i7.p1  ORF type:complete len:170 (+),score=16.35 TRINITY_DN8406_c0_g1_i7:180-689(+)
MKPTIKSLPTVTVKALTWLRDSHGLFDYESFQLVKNTLQVEGDCLIVRRGDEVRAVKKHEAGYEDERLASVACLNGGGFCVSAASLKTIYEDPEDKVWIVVKSMQAKSSKRISHGENTDFEAVLCRGDTIKLGRICFRVTDLQFNGASPSIKECKDVSKETVSTTMSPK